MRVLKVRNRVSQDLPQNATLFALKQCSKRKSSTPAGTSAQKVSGNRYVYCRLIAWPVCRKRENLILASRKYPKSIGLRNGLRSRRAGQPFAGMLIIPVAYLDLWRCKIVLPGIFLKALHFLLWNNVPNAQTTTPTWTGMQKVHQKVWVCATVRDRE